MLRLEYIAVLWNIVIQTPTASTIVIQGAIMLQSVTQKRYTVVVIDGFDDYKFSISL